MEWILSSKQQRRPLPSLPSVSSSMLMINHLYVYNNCAAYCCFFTELWNTRKCTGTSSVTSAVSDSAMYYKRRVLAVLNLTLQASPFLEWKFLIIYCKCKFKHPHHTYIPLQVLGVTNLCSSLLWTTSWTKKIRTLAWITPENMQNPLKWLVKHQGGFDWRKKLSTKKSWHYSF